MYAGNYRNKTNILAQLELTAFTNTFLIGNFYSKIHLNGMKRWGKHVIELSQLICIYDNMSALYMYIISLQRKAYIQEMGGSNPFRDKTISSGSFTAKRFLGKLTAQSSVLSA